MNEEKWLADSFAGHRDHLWAVAYRMLGSPAQADEAVEDTWLRFSRSRPGEDGSLGRWLTTIVARVCVDALRSHHARGDDPSVGHLPTLVIKSPQDETMLGDSVALALVSVLDTLAPAERLALVLHDVFELPLEDIGPMLGRSPATARRLLRRARNRFNGDLSVPGAELGSPPGPVHVWPTIPGNEDLDRA